MRRSLLRRGVLPAAAALVLLSGCSDSADEETAAPAEETATETSEPTESPADTEFCTDAAGIQERITGNAGDAGDPAQLTQVFRDAAEEIRAIEPPDELAQDWRALADGAERFATALEGVDLTDPNALATLEQALGPLEQELDSASTNVQNYLAEECGLGGATGSPAPSS